MPADEHELALALQDGVTFAELAAPVKQADGVLTCEKMVLGQADASGRRSPVGSGDGWGRNPRSFRTRWSTAGSGCPRGRCSRSFAGRPSWPGRRSW